MLLNVSCSQLPAYAAAYVYLCTPSEEHVRIALIGCCMVKRQITQPTEPLMPSAELQTHESAGMSLRLQALCLPV